MANAAALDYETLPFVTLTVQVTDSGLPALSDTASVTINLNDLPDTPPPVEPPPPAPEPEPEPEPAPEPEPEPEPIDGGGGGEVDLGDDGSSGGGSPPPPSSETPPEPGPTGEPPPETPVEEVVSAAEDEAAAAEEETDEDAQGREAEEREGLTAMSVQADIRDISSAGRAAIGVDGIGTEGVEAETEEPKTEFDLVVEDKDFQETLDQVREEVSEPSHLEATVVGSSVAVTTGLSVGYVIWLARGGLLLASLLSSMPAWRVLDPLPVLASVGGRAGDEDDESLDSLIRKRAEGSREKRERVERDPPIADAVPGVTG